MFPIINAPDAKCLHVVFLQHRFEQRKAVVLFELPRFLGLAERIRTKWPVGIRSAIEGF